MKYIFLLLMISNIASAECVKSINKSSIDKLKNGITNFTLKLKCDEKQCVCIDDFPYSINTESLKISLLDGNKLIVDPVKKEKIDSERQKKIDAENAMAGKINEFKEKLENDTATLDDIKEGLKLILK